MIYGITDICMVSHLYGFSCAFSDDHLSKKISDIADICMVSRQSGFSCVFSDYDYLNKILTPLTFVWTFKHEFSCAYADGSQKHLEAT